jgi:eukaryotic-like serine/threonine-protein kinase
MPVALKLLVSGGDKRFLREGRVLRELSDDAIVRYVAHGVTAAGRPWLALEWLEGEDLAERLEREPLGFRRV